MTADTVLLVTASYDPTPTYVGAALECLGVPFFRLDTDRFPSEVRASFDPHGDILIYDGERSISGRDIKSVWYRRNVVPNLPDHLASGIREFCARETRAFLEGVLAALPTQHWWSSPQAIWSAERKPYQLAVAVQLGFTLPRTIVTNQQTAVRSFAEERVLIAKAVSSGYISEPDGMQAIFTSAVDSDDLENLDGLSLAPVIFQERVEKESDIRVTVVGDNVYCAEILSQSQASSMIDWRATDDPHLEHRMHELPPSLASRCRHLVSRLGLGFGAIDLALKPDGTYVFFEINPNGEWLWLEDQLGLPISSSIAAWLSG